MLSMFMLIVYFDSRSFVCFNQIKIRQKHAHYSSPEKVFSFFMIFWLPIKNSNTLRENNGGRTKKKRMKPVFPGQRGVSLNTANKPVRLKWCFFVFGFVLFYGTKRPESMNMYWPQPNYRHILIINRSTNKRFGWTATKKWYFLSLFFDSV